MISRSFSDTLFVITEAAAGLGEKLQVRLFVTQSQPAAADGETAQLQPEQQQQQQLVEDLTPGLTEAGVTPTVTQGRPDFTQLFQELRGSLSAAAAPGAGVVAVPVYVCGPTAMASSVLNAAIPKVAAVADGSEVRFDVRSEPFEW